MISAKASRTAFPIGAPKLFVLVSRGELPREELL
jgi:hypothetical protein